MLYVECFPDETFVKYFAGFSKRQVKHSSNKYGVIKYLSDNPDSVGLIDEDITVISQSNNPPFLKKLKIIEEKNKIIVRKASNGSRAISFVPRLEEWFIDLAKNYNIDLMKMNIPKSGNDFHNIINNDLRKFRKLIDILEDKPEMQYLKQLLHKYYM